MPTYKWSLYKNFGHWNLGNLSWMILHLDVSYQCREDNASWGQWKFSHLKPPHTVPLDNFHLYPSSEWSITTSIIVIKSVSKLSNLKMVEEPSKFAGSIRSEGGLWRTVLSNFVVLLTLAVSVRSRNSLGQYWLTETCGLGRVITIQKPKSASLEVKSLISFLKQIEEKINTYILIHIGKIKV